jgi:hypothetical protein
MRGVLAPSKGRLIRCTVHGSTPNRFAILRTPSVRTTIEARSLDNPAMSRLRRIAKKDAAVGGWTLAASRRRGEQIEARDTRAALNAKSGANSGDRLSAPLAAPPYEQAPAREDQARQSSADQRVLRDHRRAPGLATAGGEYAAAGAYYGSEGAMQAAEGSLLSSASGIGFKISGLNPLSSASSSSASSGTGLSGSNWSFSPPTLNFAT